LGQSSLGRCHYSHIDSDDGNHFVDPNCVLDMNLDNIVAVHWDGYLVGGKADFEFDHWVHSVVMQRVVAALGVDLMEPSEVAAYGGFPP